jgi:hypothetical protein
MNSIHYPSARGEVSLTQALERCARASSRRRLALAAGAGLVIATAMLAWQPAGWVIFMSAALPFVAFGLWGIADRELDGARLAAGGAVAIALLVVRVLAVTLGALATFTLIFGLAGVAMGTWIE